MNNHLPPGFDPGQSNQSSEPIETFMIPELKGAAIYLALPFPGQPWDTAVLNVNPKVQWVSTNQQDMLNRMRKAGYNVSDNSIMQMMQRMNNPYGR